MTEDVESLKEKILAQDNEMTVEKFEALILVENSFTEKELGDLYKEFKNFLHGGKFTSYAEIIFKHYPAVDNIRSQVARKEQSKTSLTNFFGKKSADDADKRAREPLKKEGEGQSPKKKTDIKDYFQKKPM